MGDPSPLVIITPGECRARATLVILYGPFSSATQHLKYISVPSPANPYHV